MTAKARRRRGTGNKKRMPTNVIHERNDDLPLFDEHFLEVAKPFLIAAANVTKAKVMQLAPTYNSTFKNSIRVSEIAVASNTQLQIEVYSEDKPVKVAVIEGGRGANKKWPPVDVIRRWVELVISPGEAMLDRVTFLVGRKIAKKGILGHYVFEVAELVTRAEVERILDDDLPNELARLL